MDAAELGNVLRRLRAVRGLSQADAASFAGKSLRWYWALEAGTGSSRLDNVTADRLAFGFRVEPAVVLGLAPLPGSLEEDDVKRREFLFKGALAAGAAATGFGVAAGEPWEHLESVLSGVAGVDRVTLEHLEYVTVGLEAQQYTVAPGLVDQVRRHLTEIIRLLKAGGMTASARRQLLSLAGETAATAGWLRWDVDGTDADSYWRAGRAAALEGGDAALAAFIGASRSWLPRYRDEDPSGRIRILADSLSGSTPRTVVWNLMAQAEGYALLGDERRCLELLERAHGTLARIGDDRDTRRPRCDTYDEGRWLGDAGAVMVRLAAADDRFRPHGVRAQEMLARAVADLDEQPAQRRMACSLRVNLARALARCEQPEGAVVAALQALEGAQELGVTTIPDRLRAPDKLLADLAPWSDQSAVRQLRERLTAA